MTWEFQCSVDDSEFSSSGNEEGEVAESAREHAGGRRQKRLLKKSELIAPSDEPRFSRRPPSDSTPNARTN